MTNPIPDPVLELVPLLPGESAHHDAVVALWNAALPSSLQISRRLVDFNLQPIPGGRQVGWLAMNDGAPVGVIVASMLADQPHVASATLGWIDLIAVAPTSQRQGVGRQLLAAAENWLKQQGCTAVQLGANLRPFLPGLPTTLSTLPYFQQQGYHTLHQVWDVAANLATYEAPETVREIPGIVRPFQSGDAAALDEFLQREFGGRWHFAYTLFRHDERYRLSDYMVLWTARGIDGFCQLTFADSARPLERYYPYDLPRPWGQLGPIGVSADCRGQGFGAALLDAGLRRLHNNGINGCVIDWTTLLDFYGKFGFQPYRTYDQLRKALI